MEAAALAPGNQLGVNGVAADPAPAEEPKGRLRNAPLLSSSALCPLPQRLWVIMTLMGCKTEAEAADMLARGGFRE